MSLLDTKLYLREKLEPSLTLLSCHGKCFPPAYMHMYQCHLSPLMSQPSPPLTPFHQIGEDMPEEWWGSDALHPPSPGGGTLLFYVVGFFLSPSPLAPFLPLPPLTFHHTIEFAGVLVVVLGRFCSKLRCYAMLLYFYE